LPTTPRGTRLDCVPGWRVYCTRSPFVWTRARSSQRRSLFNVSLIEPKDPAGERLWRSVQSPWLVAALVLATLNLYVLWWLGRTWWQLKQEDGDAGKQPVWHVLAMFVPIYGYFRFYAHMKTIVQIAATPEARAMMSPLAMTVAWIVINLLSGVALSNQTPIWLPFLATILSAAQFGWAQYALNTAWSSLPGGTTRGRVHPLHWFLLILGFSFYGVAVVGALSQ
jgi:hypothetical protein